MSKSEVLWKKFFVVILLSTLVSRKSQEVADIRSRIPANIDICLFMLFVSYLNERFTPKVNVLA